MRSFPIQGSAVMARVPHPYPVSIHLMQRAAALGSVGAKLKARMAPNMVKTLAS